MRKYIYILLALTSQTTLFAKVHGARTVASIQQDLRVVHAKELLGKRYKKSFVAHFEKSEGLESNILKTVRNGLPANYKSQASAITEVIIKASSEHKLDPYFIMAVISGESSFNPLAVGPVGEIGLMQIRPKTGEWIAKRIKMKWRGDKTLNNPLDNIRLGTAYIGWLREKFDNHGQLYVAAYNMGPRSVKNALVKNVWPKDYPRHVMKRYFAFYKAI